MIADAKYPNFSSITSPPKEIRRIGSAVHLLLFVLRPCSI
jgi:hypothetical protein